MQPAVLQRDGRNIDICLTVVPSEGVVVPCMMVVWTEVASEVIMMLRVLGRQSTIQTRFEIYFIHFFIGECTLEFCNPHEHCTSAVEQGELKSCITLVAARPV